MCFQSGYFEHEIAHNLASYAVFRVRLIASLDLNLGASHQTYKDPGTNALRRELKGLRLIS